MPGQESVLLNAVGPQQGYGQPFAGPYSNVYGQTPGSQSAQSNYWETLNRGYQNQQDQLIRDAFQGDWTGSVQPYDITKYPGAIVYDPAKNDFTLDQSKIPPDILDAILLGQTPAELQARFDKMKNDPNEDRAQARQQLLGVAQKRYAQAARTEQQAHEVAAFNQELQRYNSPDLMAQMINPQIQQAGNQVMANANAAGMAGGSMGQAANRRAAMQGFGQGAANVVPTAAVAQAGQNFQWQRAREGMINNFYQQQQDRAQRDLSNEMNQAAFMKGFEEYEHNRDNETLKTIGDISGNVGAWVNNAAPFLKGSGGEK